MNPERFQQIEEIYNSVLARKPEDRDTFLNEACAGDESLREEVESLLARQPMAEKFIETPAMELAARGLAKAQEEGLETDLLGRSLLHYRIDKRIGEGGMGVVYKAHDAHLNRFVAIKVLPAGMVANPDRKRRFIQEARAASALNHPNIITIHDISDTDGIDFIAMEHVSGKTLDRLIPRAGMRLNQALKIAIQVAEGLSKAHEAGIIHRDLKPSNIMVTDDGLVKILDFGLAKLLDRRTSGSEEGSLSQEGMVVGTPGYMSPEQAESKAGDPRSDIFSFGSVLYEMVTGHRAFEGNSPPATLASVLEEEPRPPMEWRPEIPHELERVIQRCLRKDPAHRWQHMDDIKVELGELKEDSDSGRLTAASTAKPKRVGWFSLGAAAAVLILALAGWLYWGGRNPPLPPPRVVPLTAYPGDESSASFSPDGRQVAFGWNGEKADNYDIYVKMVESGPPRRITDDPAPDVWPAWSPDGNQIAFVRTQKDAAAIYLTTPMGGQATKLAGFRPLPNSSTVISWSPDGRWLAAAEQDENGMNGISLFPVAEGVKRRLLSDSVSKVRYAIPIFSPDARFLAYFSGAGLMNGNIYLLELDRDLVPKGQPRRLMPESGWYGTIAWAPDGRSLVYGARSSGPADSFLYRLPLFGTARPERLEVAGIGAGTPAISLKGDRLAYTLSRTSTGIDIWSLDAATPPRRFLTSSTTDHNPQFSPDGTKIAYVQGDTPGGMALWVVNRDGTSPLRLIPGGNRLRGSPRWSPDGRWLAFDGQVDDGTWRIFVIDSLGGQPRRLTSSQSPEHLPSWSRDGKRIYFRSDRTGRREVWRVPWSGGEAEQMTTNGGGAPWESWDGKTLYYTNPGGGGVFARSLAGGPELRIVEPILFWYYFPAEGGIYYITRVEAGVFEVRYWDARTEKSRPVAPRFKSGSVQSFNVSPDGKTFLFSGRGLEPSNSDLMLIENFR